MRKNIRVSEPSAEMQMKIQMARHAISSQKMRMVKCPCLLRNYLIIANRHQNIFPAQPIRKLRAIIRE